VTAVDHDLLIRASALYFPIAATIAVWLWRRPNQLAAMSAVLAWFWNLPTVLLLHVAAIRMGWWSFGAAGGLLLGMPVDLYLAWTLLWGILPIVAFPDAPVVALALALLGVDLVLMPAAVPVVVLGPAWLVGEALGLAVAFAPAFVLARWTRRREHLVARACLQVVAFSGLILLVLPAAILAGSGSAMPRPGEWPIWQWSLAAQALAVPGLIGLSAVQEFVTRGGGTPVPFDPPTRLVTTGLYAYVRNPMQMSAVLLFVILGIVLRNAWIAAGGVMAHLYSAGLAGWDEDDDLRERFGPAWGSYRTDVPRWIPRWRPWHREHEPPSRLYVAENCEVCRGVARWFEVRGASHLVVIAAESHPSRLTRVTYEPSDGGDAESGVAAIGRALEHLQLGWAMVGALFRLPIVRPLLQLLVDASGGEPRSVGVPPAADSESSRCRTSASSRTG